MKRNMFLLGTLLIGLASVFGMFLLLHQSLGVHAAGTSNTTTSAPSVTPIFQDNFDKYKVGPLPTGGTNKWNAVVVKGSGAIAVVNTQSISKPNSLQFTLGSTAKSQAWAKAKYASGTATHSALFSLYLSKNLSFGTQSLAIFETLNHSAPTNGAFQLWLAPTHDLSVVWYDSTSKKHVHNVTKTTLALGQWYSIELDQTNSKTAGSWTLSINGTAVTTQTGIDTGNTQIDEIFAGDPLSSTTAVTGSFFIDNVETAAQHI